MSGIYDSNKTTSEDETIVRISGASGDLADVVQSGSYKRLLVKSETDLSTEGVAPTFGPHVHYHDMNASNGGVARGTDVSTTYVTIFSYNGSGLFVGFLVTLESITEATWTMQILVDNNQLFDDIGYLNIDEVDSSDFYNYRSAKDKAVPPWIGLDIVAGTFRFEPKYPIRFSSSIVIKVKKTGTAREFKAGLVNFVTNT